MACCCGYKTWTKVIASFTIIFCLLQCGITIFNIYLTYTDDSISSSFIYQLAYSLRVYSETQGLNICSLIFNFIGIIACITLLTFVSKEEVTKSLLNSYVFWDILATVTFILDIVTLIIYALNFKNSYKVGDLILLVIGSRFIIIIVFNICALIGMFIITYGVYNELKEKPKQRTVPLKPPKPVLKKPQKEPYLEENNVDRVRDWYKHYERPNENIYQQQQPSGPDVIPKYIPRVNDIQKPHPEPKLSSDSFNNGNNHGLPGSNTNVLVNGVPSGTLRRQLPWTYMSDLKIPQKPFWNKPATAPYVPAPDYSVRKPKPITRRDLNEPGWNQYL